MYNPKALITQVHTDASSVALSGILMQGESIPDLYMVYAVSKKTTEPESKYHSSRLELYAHYLDPQSSSSVPVGN